MLRFLNMKKKNLAVLLLRLTERCSSTVTKEQHCISPAVIWLVNTGHQSTAVRATPYGERISTGFFIHESLERLLIGGLTPLSEEHSIVHGLKRRAARASARV
jgi:hypothetical protein